MAIQQNNDCFLYGPSSVFKEVLQYGLPKKKVRKVQTGNKIQVKDIEITVCPAYDENEPEAVTFLISAYGINIFFSGDSAAGDAFNEIGVEYDLDIAMLAFGKTWYMNESQMLDAALKLRPKLLLPYHWELWRGHTGNPLELGRLIEKNHLSFDTKLLQLGDYIHCRVN